MKKKGDKNKKEEREGSHLASLNTNCINCTDKKKILVCLDLDGNKENCPQQFISLVLVCMMVQQKRERALEPISSVLSPINHHL
mmetsp:Transcript_31110/g.50133  ORF Transcript_31110/g.50133 Transcript_31110/m.50133 type:complete len:84 (-) Transcript_31110:672-923(-)